MLNILKFVIDNVINNESTKFNCAYHIPALLLLETLEMY